LWFFVFAVLGTLPPFRVLFGMRWEWLVLVGFLLFFCCPFSGRTMVFDFLFFGGAVTNYFFGGRWGAVKANLFICCHAERCGVVELSG
jgi:hypothetical protein